MQLINTLTFALFVLLLSNPHEFSMAHFLLLLAFLRFLLPKRLLFLLSPRIRTSHEFHDLRLEQCILNPLGEVHILGIIHARIILNSLLYFMKKTFDYLRYTIALERLLLRCRASRYLLLAQDRGPGLQSSWATSSILC